MNSPILAAVLFPRLVTAQHHFTPGALVVSRVQYSGNIFGNALGFPDILSDKNVSGLQGSLP